MKQFKWLFSLLSLISSIEVFALDAEHVLWDKTPIHLTLSFMRFLVQANHNFLRKSNLNR